MISSSFLVNSGVTIYHDWLCVAGRRFINKQTLAKVIESTTPVT